MSKAKAALREKVYWPGLDRDVELKLGQCIACQANSTLPKPEP